MKFPKLNYDGFDLGNVISYNGHYSGNEPTLFTIMAKDIEELLHSTYGPGRSTKYIWECRIQISLSVLGDEKLDDVVWHLDERFKINDQDYLMTNIIMTLQGDCTVVLVPYMKHPVQYGN
jgi:hypothetical protein